MLIRHTFDEDGNGVAADGLTGVMTGMMKTGIIRMTADGTILPSRKAPQRHRELTGIDGRIVGHTDADVHVELDTTLEETSSAKP